MLGNSSIISSIISKTNFTSNLNVTTPNPVITFQGSVYTGFNILDLEALSALTRTPLIQIRNFAAVIRFNGCTLVVMNYIEFSTPRLSTIKPTPVLPSSFAVTEDVDAASALLRVYLGDNAYMNVSTNASLTVFSPTYIEADTENSPTIKNYGKITLDGSKLDLFGTVQWLSLGAYHLR